MFKYIQLSPRSLHCCTIYQKFEWLDRSESCGFEQIGECEKIAIVSKYQETIETYNADCSCLKLNWSVKITEISYKKSICNIDLSVKKDQNHFQRDVWE